jgi:hypothetical protein
MWYPHICHVITYVTIESILADDISSGKLRWMNGRMKRTDEDPLFLGSPPALGDAQNKNGIISTMMMPSWPSR